ncbi:MAG: hypothetical protein HYT12_04250 [Candidatus Liptonbacteria bacterium]|nr:hypothetical protein [Candidatus Liptonbacteria bacterium]
MYVIKDHQLKLVKELYYDKLLPAYEIAKILRVSVDAVYGFMNRHNLKRRTLAENNKIQFANKKPSFKLKGNLNEYEKELKASGTMLYWGEGFQSEKAIGVDFANCKPEMIKLFLEFLRKICGIDESRLRVYLYCYANQNINNIINFWSALTKIPKSQFTKPYIRTDFDIKKIDKMRYGLIHIRYHDKKLLNLIRGWISEYSEKFS